MLLSLSYTVVAAAVYQHNNNNNNNTHLDHGRKGFTGDHSHHTAEANLCEMIKRRCFITAPPSTAAATVICFLINLVSFVQSRDWCERPPELSAR